MQSAGAPCYNWGLRNLGAAYPAGAVLNRASDPTIHMRLLTVSLSHGSIKKCGVAPTATRAQQAFKRHAGRYALRNWLRASEQRALSTRP